MAAYVATQLQVDALEKPRGYTRLLYVLRYFCLRYGRNSDNDHVKIQLPLTQHDIANFTGMTRETISLAINKLKSKNIISADNKYYTINIKELNDLIDDDFNSGISVSMLR
jgi:biotin operon repressor